MKVIDVIKDLADGKEIKPFRIGENEFRVNYSQIQRKINEEYYSNVEWLIYKEWLNEEVEPIEDEFIDIEEPKIKTMQSMETIIENIRECEERIKDLIKNQKVLINKLKEEGK